MQSLHRPLRDHAFNHFDELIMPLPAVENGIDVILEHDLVRRMVEFLLRQPLEISASPVFHAIVGPSPCRSRKASSCRLLALRCSIASARDRTKSRMASWAGSGTHTAVTHLLPEAAAPASWHRVYPSSRAHPACWEWRWGPARCRHALLREFAGRGHSRKGPPHSKSVNSCRFLLVVS